MTVWRKSSHSESGAGGSCVELAHLGGSVGVRDSKNPEGGHLSLQRGELRRLMEVVRRTRG
ncbi:DUF397 domain-containing protein [Actinomadura oligospora]|uniref:DUF397 domain-containing protein n=1 Tax=Actinomadura oligospora TaxID=111804 RepID=UPI000478F534|nr:DUF397 domain-containing protein [Actinomadura oligospora]